MKSESLFQVYSRQGDGNWIQVGSDISGLGFLEDGETRYVSLSSDGSRLVVGDPLDDSNFRELLAFSEPEQ